MCALLFTSVVTPFEVAFLEQVQGNTLYFVNWFVDFFYLSDMVSVG